MSRVTFKCSKCGQSGEADTGDYTTEIESSEDGMGTRKEYWTEIETSCSNNKCGNPIIVTINETEYPQDDFQGETVETSSGAKEISITN
ncbi:hypothetical protein ACNSO7_12700 [Yersinia enterocolitica]|uniref:hypothetical protein n=1 Tax=Yersinia enterocolitica TaxID=630 RepID=UPI003AB70C7F